MSQQLETFTYPGYGETAKKDFWYSQAARIGPMIECSGQGGWDRQTQEIPDDLAAEIAQAFDNVDAAVRAAGGKGWSQVYKIRTYHCLPLDDEVLRLMVENMKKWSPERQPLWTCIGVASLALPRMRVEIEVNAYDG